MMGKKNILKRAPCTKPPFTVGDLKKAIPPHCFEKYLLRSFSYVMYDFILVIAMYYIATNYFHLLPSPYRYMSWPVYWIFQACLWGRFWVIAHECGHHAFSDYQCLDDTLGLILHSALLVPYFSFKYSHRRHHSNIASLDRAENYVPRPKSEREWYSKIKNPAGRILFIIFGLTLGWPLYLAFNFTGRSYDRFACHFDPNSPLFNNRERLQVFISDVGPFAVTYLLYCGAMAKGLAWLVRIYVVPLLVVNSLFVVITYLQHNHPALPYYDSSEWNWLRGALVTVDRDYGILNKLLHHITDTHVLHHLFSTIPHYHAMEATKAIKPLLGEYYQFDGTPICKALWRELGECIYIEPDEEREGVFWFNNKF